MPPGALLFNKLDFLMCTGSWFDHEWYRIGYKDATTGASYTIIILITTVAFEDLAERASVRAKSSLTVIILDRFCS